MQAVEQDIVTPARRWGASHLPTGLVRGDVGAYQGTLSGRACKVCVGCWKDGLAWRIPDPEVRPPAPFSSPPPANLTATCCRCCCCCMHVYVLVFTRTTYQVR